MLALLGSRVHQDEHVAIRARSAVLPAGGNGTRADGGVLEHLRRLASEFNFFNYVHSDRGLEQT
jgi:hypothetical protein